VNGAHVRSTLQARVFGPQVVEFFGRKLKGHPHRFGLVQRNDGEHLSGYFEHKVVGSEGSGDFGLGQFGCIG
jgi:hypothetical protein